MLRQHETPILEYFGKMNPRSMLLLFQAVDSGLGKASGGEGVRPGAVLLLPGWDKYSGGVHYELVYYAADAPAGVPRTEALIPSRRWEAWREATEDFEYLHRLREATQDARKAGMDEAPVAQADRTLQRVVEEVVRKTTAPGRYDRARKDLTQEILNLAGRGSSR